MALTYDERSNIRLAFDEAYVQPDRRRALRIEQRVAALISPWHGEGAGEPFEVHIEDFSATGVRISHREPLKVGSDYLLTVPRAGQTPIGLVLTVVRHLQRDDGNVDVAMEMHSLLDEVEQAQTAFPGISGIRKCFGETICSKRTKILFLLFGILGLTVALLIK